MILRPSLTPVHLVVRHREALDFRSWVLLASCLHMRWPRERHCLVTGFVEFRATGADGSKNLTGLARVGQWREERRPAERNTNDTCSRVSLGGRIAGWGSRLSTLTLVGETRCFSAAMWQSAMQNSLWWNSQWCKKKQQNKQKQNKTPKQRNYRIIW